MALDQKLDRGLLTGPARYDVRKVHNGCKHEENDGSEDARQVGWNEGQAVHGAAVCEGRRHSRLEDDTDE